MRIALDGVCVICLSCNRRAGLSLEFSVGLHLRLGLGVLSLRSIHSSEKKMNGWFARALFIGHQQIGKRFRPARSLKSGARSAEHTGRYADYSPSPGVALQRLGKAGGTV